MPQTISFVSTSFWIILVLLLKSVFLNFLLRFTSKSVRKYTHNPAPRVGDQQSINIRTEIRLQLITPDVKENNHHTVMKVINTTFHILKHSKKMIMIGMYAQIQHFLVAPPPVYTCTHLA